MTGPFSSSTPQMPQPPNLPYPAAPYPILPPPVAHYPSLPFSQPTLPGVEDHQSDPWSTNTHSTISRSNQFSPLDSVPFEARFSIDKSTNLTNIDQLFKEMKQNFEKIDRADAYLRSKESDYDFKVEQGLIYQ